MSIHNEGAPIPASLRGRIFEPYMRGPTPGSNRSVGLGLSIVKAIVRAHGGMIDAREASGGWVPAQSLYRVVLSLDEAPPFAPRSWRGHVVIEDAAESLALRAWRRLSAAWVREAGF